MILAKTAGNYKERFCLLCVLRDLARFLLRQKKRGVSLSPWPLVNNIKYFSENFRRNEHEDVSEFIESLLNKLELCYNVPSENDDMPSESHNLVQHTFQFLLVSKLKCSTCCQTFSTSHENFYNLSLPIVAGQTFLEALRSFMGVEKIDNHICGKCKEVVSAEKQYFLEKIPTIAIFQLKRFSNKGPIIEKIVEHVQFPLQFDILCYSETNNIDNMEDNYSLFAFIVHIGSTLGEGHYCCFIRLAANKWLKFDDSTVKFVDEDIVLSENPYILFYAHSEVAWFSSYINNVDWLANKLDNIIAVDGRSLSRSNLYGVDTYNTSVSDVEEGKDNLSLDDEVSPVSDAEQSNDSLFCDEPFKDVVSPVSYVEQDDYSLFCDETFEDVVSPVSTVEEVTTASKRKLEEDSENLATSVAYSILGKKKVHEIGEGPRFGRRKTRFAPTPPPTPTPTETENKDDSTTNPASSAVEENSSDGENQD